MCDCNIFCKILCTIILIIAFLVNTLGNWVGVGDIIPTEKCLFGCTCHETTLEATTELSTALSEAFTTAVSTEPSSAEATTQPATKETTAATTTATTTTTTTATITEPTTTTTTAPTTTTTTTAPTTTTTTTTATATTTTTKIYTTKKTTATTATADANTSAVTFGGDGNDIFRGVAATSDGGYVACGTTTSTDGVFADLFNEDWYAPFSFVVKFDKDAKVKWVKAFGSDSYAVFLEDIAVLENGSIIAVGYKHMTDSELIETVGISDAVIYSLAASTGRTQREKTYSGTKTDIFNCVSATPEGFVVGGKSDSANGAFAGIPENSALIFSFDTSFNFLWKKSLSGSKGASVDGISADKNGNVFAACLTSSTDGDFADFEELMGGYTDTVIIKYDSSGNYKWDFVIATSGRDEFSSVAADGSGGCVVGGNYELITTYAPDGTLSDVHNCGGIDALVFRINANGTEKWKKVFSGLYDDYITGIDVSSKGYAVSGYTKSGNRDFSAIGNLGGFDGYVRIISTTGSTVKLCSQAGSLEDTSLAIAFSTSGNVLTVGKTKSVDGNFTGNSNGGYTGYAAVYSI